jgi:hypothetical protein
LKRQLLVLLGCLPAVFTLAASPGGATITPADRKWEPFGLADRAVVLGDLSDTACPSVTLLRLYPETRLPPHSVPVDRTYLVLSGTIHVGFGKKWDEAGLKTLPPGSFWLVPANTSTFEWSEDEVVCQVTVSRPARECPRPGTPVVFTPDQVPWKRTATGERAVLTGEPDWPACPGVVRYRIPAGAPSLAPSDAIAGGAHWTVLSGDLLREAVDPGNAASRDLPAGTVFVPSEGKFPKAGVETVVQREFLGTGPRACKWRAISR